MQRSNDVALPENVFAGNRTYASCLVPVCQHATFYLWFLSFRLFYWQKEGNQLVKCKKKSIHTIIEIKLIVIIIIIFYFLKDFSFRGLLQYFRTALFCNKRTI